jgi:hypothetical protein
MPVVSYEDPENVETAPGERQDDLLVGLPLSAFALVEPLGFGTVHGGHLRACRVAG